MTEAEWLSCHDPFLLLKPFGEVSQRKGRLLVVGCCRQHNRITENALNRKAINAIELFADGMLTSEQLSARRGRGIIGYRIATTCSVNCSPAMFVIVSCNLLEGNLQHEQVIQCRLIRDIFGNPFRPITADPRWLTETVVALAQGIYDDRAFERMPILADALEEAGCESEDVLRHCREPSEHVRGCWVVDLLLGKQ